jgi:hypothetical protein
MARARTTGNGRLEEALARLAEQQETFQQAQAALTQAQATLVLNQANFVAQMAEIDARLAETNRLNAERFARIEALLLEHNRILQALPDAIRDKIGFKAPGPRKGEAGGKTGKGVGSLSRLFGCPKVDKASEWAIRGCRCAILHQQAGWPRCTDVCARQKGKGTFIIDRFFPPAGKTCQ